MAPEPPGISAPASDSGTLAARASLLRRPGAAIALLGIASLLAYAVQGGLAERVYTTWHLANAVDRAVSATMPLAGLFRGAVAWVPRRLPAPLPGSSGAAAPFLMAIWSYFAIVALLFALYALALGWLARHPTPPSHHRRVMALIAGGGIAFGALLLFTPAAPSHDPVAYATAGRLLAAHGANPFFVVPSAYPHDAVLAANEWPNSTTAYGPLWALLSLAVNPLVAGDPLRANFIYRVVAFLAEVANIALVAALVSRLPARFAAWRERGLLLYAWNPLLVIEVAAGHNDILMLTLLLLGLLLIGRQRAYWGMTSLGAAVLLKFNALPLALVIALDGWLAVAPAIARRAAPRAARGQCRWHRWREWTGGLAPALVALAVIVAGYLPFYWGHSPSAIAAASKLQPTTQALDRALVSSFGTLAGSGAIQALPAPVAVALAGAIRAASNPTFWTLVLGVALVAATFFMVPRLREPEALAPVLAWIYAIWMIFLCIFKLLRTWYLIPLVGLVSLTPLGRPIRRFVISLTATMQVQVLFLSQSPPFNGWQPWTLLPVLGVPLAVLAATLRQERRDGRATGDWRAATRASYALLRTRLGLASGGVVPMAQASARARNDPHAPRSGVPRPRRPARAPRRRR